MKEELFYSRGDKSEKIHYERVEDYDLEILYELLANRRICTANGGLPPAVRRKLYYDHIFLVA